MTESWYAQEKHDEALAAKDKEEQKEAAKARIAFDEKLKASVDPSRVIRPPSGKKESTGKSIEMTDLKRPERPERPTAADEGSTPANLAMIEKMLNDEGM